MIALAIAMLAFAPSAARSAGSAELDPYVMREVFCRFPFAQVIPLDSIGGWGLIYGDTYGKLHLLKATPKGLKLEWELTNLGVKIRRFFVRDLDADGVPEIIVATVDGRILVYSTGTFQNVWENLEDSFVDSGDRRRQCRRGPPARARLYRRPAPLHRGRLDEEQAMGEPAAFRCGGNHCGECR
jgi:hypothetical protein